MSKLKDILSSSYLPAKSLTASLLSNDALSTSEIVLRAHENKAHRLSEYAKSMAGGGEVFNKDTAADILVQLEILSTACITAFNQLCKNDTNSDLAKKLKGLTLHIDTMSRAAVDELRAPLELHSDIQYRPHEALSRARMETTAHEHFGASNNLG